MPIAFDRLARHTKHQANLATTGGDKEALVTLLIPRPRSKSIAIHAGGLEFSADIIEWEYHQEEHVRAAPPADEIERARAEGRLQDGKPSFYSRFYNDNQLNKKVRFGESRSLSFDAGTLDEESGGINDTIYREATPGAFRAHRAEVHARHAKPHRTPITRPEHATY